jgi:callose synthase
MQSNKDHPDKRNYDDFNEFFWSRECLTYRYSALDESELQDAEEGVRTAAAAASTGNTPIAVALAGAGKTYLEKRSWTRGILALNRIIEWHFITFYILSVIAFSNELVWGWVYSVQVLSGVFWLLNLLHLTWGMLEVWCIYPGIYLSGSAICGHLFSNLTRFLILVYQTLYLMYTFGPKGNTYFDMEDKDSNFWWWQYIWLSLLCMIPYFVEALLQLYPAMTTKLYTSQNDYIQSFLNVLFPLSRLYVAKELHESLRHTLTYILFWVTLIIWKLYFSYIFEVDTMVLPTLQLTDDYVNLQNQNFWQMGLLLILRWSPQFVVYMIDMSIWYAVWQAFAGTAGGFKDHLGDVRSINDIRENFTRAPENFCKKMLSPDAGSRRGSSASFLKQNSQGDITTEGAGVNESSALLGSDPQKLQSYVNRLLDVRIQKWVMFSAVWNEIIDHFRQEDILSNREMEYLKFSRFDGFNQAIYLPVFQTAGVVENALNALEKPRGEESASLSDEQLFKPVLENVTMRTAVSEVWELGSYVFVKMLGQLHADDVSNITGTFLKWAQAGELCNHAKMERMRSVMTQFVNLITCLEKGMCRRKPSSNPRVSASNRTGKQDNASSKMTSTAPSGGVRRTVSAGSLAILGQVPKEELDAAAHESQQTTLKQSKKQLDVRDALRDQVRDKLRGVLNSLKGMISNAESDAQSRDVLDRLTFIMSMENGFMWDDAYASDQLDEVAKNSIFNKVLTKGKNESALLAFSFCFNLAILVLI